MDSTDEIPSFNYYKREFKNKSPNNFRKTFSNSFKLLEKEENIRINSPNKRFISNNRIKSGKKQLYLPEEQNIFVKIKNKEVRNFYETILKNSCREKEPKTKNLKNIFRLKNTKNFIIKPIVKKVSHSNSSQNIKKSRTSNSLPFIQVSQNVNNIYPINNNGFTFDIENKNNMDNNKNNDNVVYKIPSLFLKNAGQKHKIKNLSHSIEKTPIALFLKNKNKNIKNELIFSDNKNQKSVDLKKNKTRNNYDIIIGKLNYKISKLIS